MTKLKSVKGNPAKTLRDLRGGARAHRVVLVHSPIRFGPYTDELEVLVFVGQTILAEARAYRRGKVFYVKHAKAYQRGWGPLVYDLLMERATEMGAALAPDDDVTSDDARNVWKKYSEREDVEMVKRLREPEFVGDGWYEKYHETLNMLRRSEVLEEREGTSD